MKTFRRRRTPTEVIIDILNEASEGANKTKLMYRCNLNFKMFNRYLKKLLDAGLIEKTSTENTNNMAIYKTSQKGQELLKVLQKANKMLSS